MPGLRLLEFKGLLPRLDARRQPTGHAEMAEDVDLSRGTIATWRTPKTVQMMSGVKAMHQTETCLLTDTCQNVWWSDSSPDCRMIVKSGKGEPPKWATESEACAGIWRRMGLPLPQGVIAASNPGAANVTAQGRTYVAAFRDAYGNVGAGSFPSNVISAESGQAVTLSNIPQPPTMGGWDVADICIYRSIRPFVPEEMDVQVRGNEIAHKQAAMSFLILVAVLEPGVTSFVDTAPDDFVGGSFVSGAYAPPPADLEQVLVMESGRAVGRRGNEVWFSEPFTLHAWPQHGRVKLDDYPVAIATARDWVYVATDGRPYAIHDSPVKDIEGQSTAEFELATASCRQVIRHNDSHQCCAYKSMQAHLDGAIYSSKEGLVRLEKGSMSVISAPWYSKRDWEDAVWPHTGIAAAWGSRYIFATSKITLLFTFDVNATASEKPTLTTMSIRPKALHATRKGRLLYAEAGNIQAFNEGHEWLAYYWRMTPYTMPALTCLSAAKVVADATINRQYANPIVVTHFVHDGRKLLERTVKTVSPYRLPRATSLNCAIAVRGKVEVTEIHIATSIADLGALGAGA